MSGALAWSLVACGLGVVVVRRRSVAVALVTVQAITLVGLAVHDGKDAIAAAALAARAVALGAVFLGVVLRTREARPVRSGTPPLVRAGVGVVLALVLTWLVPSVGLDSRDAERAVLALVGLGVAAVLTRKATLFQVLGIVLVENGLAFAALELRGGASLAIELGVAFDLMLVAVVAALFHERIFAEFGSGDAALLRALRD